MKFNHLFYLLFVTSYIIAGCNDDAHTNHDENTKASDTPAIREENVSYSAGSTGMNGFVVYETNSDAKRPGILLVHEWWGLNDYVKKRARELAAMGYITMAVDMFGDGKTAANPDEAGKLAGPFYQDPSLTKTRLDAALAKLRSYEQLDTSRIAAIGYCFGGFVVLNASRLGADLDGVVSFHGNVAGVPVRKDLLRAKTLVCHGEADQFVPAAEIAQFKKSMDSVGAVYTLKTYPGATHAFTNPDATETGRKFNIPIAYNAAADSTSWNDMKLFFGEIFR
jgi:dienelactone hydrolase